MIEDFFKITTNLKKIPRKGWSEKLGISNPESVADHTFSMSTIAMVLSDLQNLDTHKVLKMCLLHDVAESITGDFTPDEITKKEKTNLENNTMQEIFGHLPKELQNDYLAIWNEYNENVSKEAKLVHEVDKLEMVFQGLEYAENGIEKEKLNPFFDSAKKQINSNQLRAILDKLVLK